jgi:hypothetical protein
MGRATNPDPEINTTHGATGAFSASQERYSQYGVDLHLIMGEFGAS